MSITATTTKTLTNGVKIPVLGFGTYQTPKEKTESIVHAAFKLGYRHVDTAQLYENERECALAVIKFLKESPKVSRDQVFYTTKVAGDNHGYEAAKKSIIESLERAKELEYVDLFLIHNPCADTEKRLGTYKALQEFYKAGKIKAIGVSNYSIKHLEELYSWEGLEVKPMVNQFELNPWLTRKDLVKYCKDKNLVIEAFSPITRAKRFSDPVVEKLLKESYPGRTPAQLLIRWSLQMGFIPLPKSVHEDRAESNLHALDFEISPEDMKALTHDDDHFLAQPGFDPIETED
ncbi:LAQU0S14e01288g1_1 [Lachancea quebecensis]|uniref:LAQU0S14e01288g1_1 n=1 Tax=Lachancea quebecensis TaxID=1654605 RepID=A0A0P1KW61_9SACH|nr:LAQU0S14e01288g1_1 [Lachancea quebecensis]